MKGHSLEGLQSGEGGGGGGWWYWQCSACICLCSLQHCKKGNENYRWEMHLHHTVAIVFPSMKMDKESIYQVKEKYSCLSLQHESKASISQLWSPSWLFFLDTLNSPLFPTLQVLSWTQNCMKSSIYDHSCSNSSKLGWHWKQWLTTNSCT